MEYALRQNGRASIDFLMDAMAMNVKNLRSAIAERAPKDLESGTSGAASDQSVDFEEHMRVSPDFRLFGMIRRWQLNEHGRIAKSAFNEIEGDVSAQLKQLEEGPSELTLAANFTPPSYWPDVTWHGTDGGWDGHKYMGFVHGELVFRTMICGSMPGDPLAQRANVFAVLEDFSPKKIVEIGTGSGQFTEVIAARYPNAHITSCDLSRRQLEHAHRRANALGHAVSFRQAAGEDTGLEARGFDLVTSYAVFHELPESAAEAQLAEAFRLLRPGGRILIADVKAYEAMEAFDAWQSDFWNQVHGDDPYWRAHGTRDMAALAGAAGFESIAYRGIGEAQYPYVLSAEKPV